MKDLSSHNNATAMQPKAPASTMAPGNDESTFESLVEEIEAAELEGHLPTEKATAEQTEWLPARADVAVEKVNAIAHKSVERGMEEIGDYLFVEAFNSKLDAVRSKNPRKRAYFNAICEHPNLRVDARRLNEAVKAAALSRLLKERELELINLSFTHKVHLSRIPDTEKMVELAIEANEKGYSVSELRDIVAALLPRKTRGLAKFMVKTIHKPNEMRANEEAMNMLSNPVKLAEQLEEADRMGLRIASAQTRKQLTEYCDLLQQLETSFFDIELAERQKLLTAE